MEKNFLDFIPAIKKDLEWKTETDGKITVIYKHRGLTSKIANIIFKMPEKTQVHLDELGSFVWINIDGKNSVYDISQKVKEQFNNQAEPLYERICQYFKVLKFNEFIEIKDKKLQNKHI